MNWKKLIMPAIFLIAAACCNATMDKLWYHYDKSIFANWENQQWTDPRISWKNKWAKGYEDNGEKERFPGSSTIFVFMTDLWHFAKQGMLLFISLALAWLTAGEIKKRLLWALAWMALFSIVFELMFRWGLAG